MKADDEKHKLKKKSWNSYLTFFTIAFWAAEKVSMHWLSCYCPEKVINDSPLCTALQRAAFKESSKIEWCKYFSISSINLIKLFQNILAVSSLKNALTTALLNCMETSFNYVDKRSWVGGSSNVNITSKKINIRTARSQCSSLLSLSTYTTEAASTIVHIESNYRKCKHFA